MIRLAVPPPKIITRIFGGLGNQLFIYAASRRLALVNHSELVLDDVSGFVRDYQYQRHYQLDNFSIPCRKATAIERLEPFARLRSYLNHRWNQRLPFEQRSYLAQEGINFDSRLLTFKVRGTLYLDGYWQSEDYFKDVELQIRDDLRIKPPTDPVNHKIAAQIRGTNAVAVHVRFFDTREPTLDNEFMNNAPVSYYRRAIEDMETRITDPHYYLFSDKPEAVRALIPLPDRRVTLVHHNQGDAMAYADLWLMTQCRHFIIANSTFSWWGAWLAENTHKIIIAPRFEQRTGNAWGFPGLLPASWITLNI